MTADTIISNCDALVPGEDARLTIRKGCDILIQDGRIAAIRDAAVAEESSAAEIINGRVMLAMPGLINTHAHAPMVIFRGLAEDVSIERWFNEFMWPLESNLQEEDIYWGMQLALAEMIESGVTTVADHYFFMDQAAQAVTEAGTRGAGLGCFRRRRLRGAGSQRAFRRALAGQSGRPSHVLDGPACSLHLRR